MPPVRTLMGIWGLEAAVWVFAAALAGYAIQLVARLVGYVLSAFLLPGAVTVQIASVVGS